MNRVGTKIVLGMVLVLQAIVLVRHANVLVVLDITPVHGTPGRVPVHHLKKIGMREFIAMKSILDLKDDGNFLSSLKFPYQINEQFTVI